LRPAKQKCLVRQRMLAAFVGGMAAAFRLLLGRRRPLRAGAAGNTFWGAARPGFGDNCRKGLGELEVWDRANHSGRSFRIAALINRERNRASHAPDAYRREGTAVCLLRWWMTFWLDICSTELAAESLIAAVF